MVWNIGVSNDSSDVDLHLKHQTSTGWFDAGGDCFFYNCNASSGANLEWGAFGAIDNPRLDLDDVEGNGPENINIDIPENGTTYTVGIHYWDNDREGSATVVVRIYCNMSLAKEFEPVVISASGANRDDNDFWIAADIIYNVDNCTINEYGSPGNRHIVDKRSLSDF